MNHRPHKQGLYDPRFEHDNCGVGFVCNVTGKKSHEIVRQGITVLERLSHRGAVGADPKTGDGAGLLIQIPHTFFQQQCRRLGIDLPEENDYGVGLVFLPPTKRQRARCKNILEGYIKKAGQTLLGWRDVPVDNSVIGVSAQETEPVMQQVFIGKGSSCSDQFHFERTLYVVRNQTEHAIRKSKIKEKSYFYITNLSSRTLSYKGLLMPEQLESFFLDLADPNMASALALVHSRYSTNTFPTWDLAQPFRFLAHNGEINTLRGNINWMAAREKLLKSDLFGKDLKKLFPIITEGLSDSATIDCVLELLVLSGRSLPHAMMMLVPESWNQKNPISDQLRTFYEYHATMMEPWDGPAAIVFTDGRFMGATLDRNGLRPARYVVTKDDFMVMASEMGVLDIDPAQIRTNGRLEPGKMLLIDTKEGRIVSNEEIKEQVSARCPYKEWITSQRIMLDDLPKAKPLSKKLSVDEFYTRIKVFGYTREDIRMLLAPMATEGIEPTGSMGNDVPLAVLSEKPQLLYNYFKQLFAQVTNPAIDPIREKIVMSLVNYIGPRKNLLDETPEHCRVIRLSHPILKDEQLEKIRFIKEKGFKTKTLDITFEADGAVSRLKQALDQLNKDAAACIKQGCSFIVLSDRAVSRKRVAIPALLAIGSVHHHLVRLGIRTQVGLIVETGEAREVMHFALLTGYGAEAINPYMAFEVLHMMRKEGDIPQSYGFALIEDNYIQAINKGLLKVFSKMGVSTVRSYCGAQIFEAIGLSKKVVDRYFPGTVSRVEGLGIHDVAREVFARHQAAYQEIPLPNVIRSMMSLPSGGHYQWRKDGEFHFWNPDTIATLQQATRNNDARAYEAFSSLVNQQAGRLCTLRGLLTFKKRKSIPLNEVEPAMEIFKRFATGAMSFGSISKETHETIAVAMNRIGGRSNTGEGGEDPIRFTPLPNGDSLRSSIKQIASGRFGVSNNYLTNADEIQIKIAQGAKPGEGGQLPGHKVNAVIARIRYSTPGVTLISPPPHHDIYSIEDLAQLIFDLKNVNPRARISVKLVSEMGVGTIAAGVAKGHADMILISGHDGGTGASPMSSIKHAGLPWELGLSETHQTLVLNNLRGRVRLQTDGQMRTGQDVAIAALLGAEEYGFSSAALVILGCVMLRHCHLNNCSMGVATQDEMLRKRFSGLPEYLINYFHFVAEELRQLMARLGFRSIEEMIGRVDVLDVNKKLMHWKAKGLDYSRILYKPKVSDHVATHCMQTQDHGIDFVLDRTLIERSMDALDRKGTVAIELPINNTNRTTGAMLSGEISKRHGVQGLPDKSIHIKFCGTAGQSFGAFLAKGVTLELEGDANDYVGKGISGGRIVLYPSKKTTFVPEENVIIGNTCFYGATAGEAYIYGLAGERFGIRNSGLYAVVEGVGDHGCEYMTGGRIVILGRVGRNFAAGMSGGIAYVYNDWGNFEYFCNKEMVLLEEMAEEDELTIHDLVRNYHQYTGSPKAKMILDDFKVSLSKFVKVMPIEYKRVLQGMQETDVALIEVSDG